IELRLVSDDEALQRTDDRRGAQHVERQRAGGGRGQAQRVIRAGPGGSLARHRGHAIRLEHPCREDLRGGRAPAARPTPRAIVPVFWTSSVKRPNCPRYMVVGPPLVSVTAEIGTVTVCASWQSSTPGVPLVSVQE